MSVCFASAVASPIERFDRLSQSTRLLVSCSLFDVLRGCRSCGSSAPSKGLGRQLPPAREPTRDHRSRGSRRTRRRTVKRKLRTFSASGSPGRICRCRSHEVAKHYPSAGSVAHVRSRMASSQTERTPTRDAGGGPDDKDADSVDQCSVRAGAIQCIDGQHATAQRCGASLCVWVWGAARHHRALF